MKRNPKNRKQLKNKTHTLLFDFMSKKTDGKTILFHPSLFITSFDYFFLSFINEVPDP